MNYKTIKRNYEKGLWNAALVKMAVKKGLITQEQCDEILGEKA
ncbi:MAG: XkdX family protein [Clostridia bacterium]|nr:XkdX family protein [Clostridia bacterium]